MRRLEVAIAAVALAVLAFGIALQPLLAPAFTRALTARYSELPPGQAAAPAEVSRRYVTGDPSSVAEFEQLMPDAVSHMTDVRKVITGGNTVAFVLALGLSVWMALRLLRKRPEPVVAALRFAAVIDIVLIAAIGLLGLTDFDTLFARFHGLFFAAGTWTFPSDSLLIRLFPEQFWITAAAAWAGLVVVIATLYALLGWLLARSGRASQA